MGLWSVPCLDRPLDDRLCLGDVRRSPVVRSGDDEVDPRVELGVRVPDAASDLERAVSPLLGPG